MLFWHKLFCATHARIHPGFILNFSLTGHGAGRFLTTDSMNFSHWKQVQFLALKIFYTRNISFTLYFINFLFRDKINLLMRLLFSSDSMLPGIIFHYFP